MLPYFVVTPVVASSKAVLASKENASAMFV
jgi:hypothetical protein